MTTGAEVGVMESVALRVERAHEPRAAGGLQQLEKARKHTLPGALLTTRFYPSKIDGDPFWISELQNHKMINLRCLKPRSL